jgi:hypothetical protein
MTDEELLGYLRRSSVGYTHPLRLAADRIETLVKERDARPTWQEWKDILYAGYRQKARVMRLEAALRKIADDDGAGTWQSNHARAALKGDDHE